ncbi:hypothetical protein L873DRAFT_353320 [Choiromyces venosus 120613-1]|uniref:Uncharacterized protein n=1 Tax=Choiromyces venosus 120613-1 TaxID=1336337 RepID=A0A3N4IXU0_9PEZI|nr:hypothetical protein L873DRAFT_353320 [Choiromyces venosus 120613-1]
MVSPVVVTPRSGKAYWVFLLVDTGSPLTYLSTQTMIGDRRLSIFLDIVTVFPGRPRIHILLKLTPLAWTSPTFMMFSRGITAQISEPNCTLVENVGRLWESLGWGTCFVSRRGARGHKWRKSFLSFSIVCTQYFYFFAKSHYQTKTLITASEMNMKSKVTGAKSEMKV